MRAWREGANHFLVGSASQNFTRVARFADCCADRTPQRGLQRPGRAPLQNFHPSLCFHATCSALFCMAMTRVHISSSGGFQALVLAGLLMALVWPASAEPPTPTATSPATNHWSTNWTALFDGKTLTNWAVTDFAGHGPITVDAGEMKIAMGD